MEKNSLLIDAAHKLKRTLLKEDKMQIPTSNSETLPKVSDVNENVPKNHNNFESSLSKNSLRETMVSLPEITFPSSRDPHQVEKPNRYASSPKVICRKKRKKKKRHKRKSDACGEKKTKLHQKSKRSKSRERKKRRKHSSGHKKKRSSSSVEGKREKKHSRSSSKKEKRSKHQDIDALTSGNSTKRKPSVSSTDRHGKKNGPRNRAESKSKRYGEKSRSNKGKLRSDDIVLQKEDMMTKELVSNHPTSESVENTREKSSSSLVQLPTSEVRHTTAKSSSFDFKDDGVALPTKLQNQSWRKQAKSSLIYSKSVSVQLMCEESDGEDEEHELEMPAQVTQRASSTESELEKIKNSDDGKASTQVHSKTEQPSKVQGGTGQDRRSSSSLSYSPIEKYPHRYLDIFSDMPKKMYRRARIAVVNEEEESRSSDSTDNRSGDKTTDCPAGIPDTKAQQQVDSAEDFLRANCVNVATASTSVCCSDNGHYPLNEDDENSGSGRATNASAAVVAKQVSQTKQSRPRMVTSLQQLLSVSLRNREASFSDSDSSCERPLRRCTLKLRNVASRSSNSSQRSHSRSASSISGRSSRNKNSSSRLACRKRKRRRRSNTTSEESDHSARHSRSYSSASSYRSRSRSASNSSSGSTSEGRSKRSKRRKYYRTSRSRSKKSRSSHSDCSSVSTKSRSRARSRSLSIPRRKGSPSFLERRRITSARKRPIPYQRSSVLRSPSTSSSSSPCRSSDSSSSRSRSSSALRQCRRSRSMSRHSSWSSGFHRRRSSSCYTPSPIVRRSPVAWLSKHSGSYDKFDQF